MSIEVSNLQKTYKERKGTAVHAIKGVSFNLPDSGMVFVLGKSGCGKSTLLNLLGGLDGFEDGDIVVDGKSMKNFSQKDYDNYRNNFVGFVFQENNLLNEYSVKYNVGLALDLQKERHSELIESALDSVGLKEFAERKCNSISGGQKQRVAIARAIIKKPKILLCDEPTGSLDSETGAEIFKLLKGISKDTLVVVVTHDRDSAKDYGDRTIEIKDGEIVSDEGFNAEEKEITPQPLKKRKGLPLTRALGLGASFLIAHPFQFAFCVLICLITFTCVGISDGFNSYDRVQAIVENMEDYETSYLSYTKNPIDGKNQISQDELFIMPSENERLKSILNSPRVDNCYDFQYVGGEKQFIESENLYIGQITQTDTANICNGYVVMDESLPSDYGFELYGRVPKARDEVVITKHIFKIFAKCGYTVGENKYSILTYDYIVGKTITLTTNHSDEKPLYSFKVVGILDTKYNEKIYGNYVYNIGVRGELSTNGLYNMSNFGMHNALFTSADFREEKLKQIIEKKPNLTEYAIGDIKVLFAPNTRTFTYKEANIFRDYKYDFDSGEEDIKFYTYYLSNDATAVMDFVYGRMDGYAMVFTYLAIGSTVLSVLFLLYFTVGIVSEKYREIGILRALGASSGDIAKIFGAENGILAATVIALSSVLSAVGLIVLNDFFAGKYSVKVTLLGFSVRQFAILFGVAVLTIAVGIAIPLIRMILKKPVDIIAGRN